MLDDYKGFFAAIDVSETTSLDETRTKGNAKIADLDATKTFLTDRFNPEKLTPEQLKTNLKEFKHKIEEKNSGADYIAEFVKIELSALAAKLEEIEDGDLAHKQVTIVYYKLLDDLNQKIEKTKAAFDILSQQDLRNSYIENCKRYSLFTELPLQPVSHIIIDYLNNEISNDELPKQKESTCAPR